MDTAEIQLLNDTERPSQEADDFMRKLVTGLAMPQMWPAPLLMVLANPCLEVDGLRPVRGATQGVVVLDECGIAKRELQGTGAESETFKNS